MSTEILTQALGAGGSATFGAGSVFLLTAAPGGPVSIIARSIGNSNKNRTFTNVPAGFKFTADSPDDGFDTLIVTSASAQTIQIAVGTDDVDFSQSVTVANTVNTEELPTGALTDQAPVSAVNAAQTHIVPANAARRMVTLSVDPGAAAPVFFRSVNGANNLLVGQPGMSYTFRGTYGVDVRNDTGAAVNIYIAEES